MKSKQLIGIGIIGCGYFGEKRISECMKLPETFRIEGASDTNNATLNKINALYKIPVSTHPDALFNSKTIDAIIICTPNFSHKDIAIRALVSGKHVLCEKPIADTVKNARSIVHAADKAGKFVKTGSNHRFFPTVMEAWNRYNKGEIGNILRFQGSIGTNGERTANGWFWDKTCSGGGTYIDNACHLLDIARMFMGDFVKCSGSVFTQYWKTAHVEDFGIGQFIDKVGRPAIITSSWTQWSGYMYFELWGDRGFIIVDSRGGHTITIGDKTGNITYAENFASLPVTSYKDELLYFADCIRKNIEPQPNAKDGLSVIRMIEGVYTSSASAGWVNI